MQNDLSGTATLNSGIHGSNFQKIYTNYVNENGALDAQSAALAGLTAVDEKKKAFKIEIATFFQRVETYKPASVPAEATVDLKTGKPASEATKAANIDLKTAKPESTQAEPTVDLKTGKPASAETEATIDLKPVDMTDINKQIETTEKQIIDSTAKVVEKYNTIMGNTAINVQAPVETVNSEKVAENQPLEINGIRNMLNYLRKLRLNNIFMLGTKIKNKVLVGLMNSLKEKQGLKLSLKEMQKIEEAIDQAYAEIVDTAIEAGGDDLGRAAADSLNDPSGGEDKIVTSLGEALSGVKDQIANSIVANAVDAVQTNFYLKGINLGADFGKKGSEYVLGNVPDFLKTGTDYMLSKIPGWSKITGKIAYIANTASPELLAQVAKIPGLQFVLVQGAKMTWRAYNTPEDSWLPFIHQMTKLSTQYLNLPDSQVMRNLKQLQISAERMRITRNAAFDAADAAKSAAKSIKDQALGRAEKDAREFVLGFDTLRGYNFVGADGNVLFDSTNLPPPASLGKFNLQQFVLSNLATGAIRDAKHVKQLLRAFDNSDKNFETTNFSWMPSSFQQATQLFGDIGDMALRNPELFPVIFGDISANVLDAVKEDQSTSVSSERLGKAFFDNVFSKNWQSIFGIKLGEFEKNSITKIKHIIEAVTTVYTTNIDGMIGLTQSGIINSPLYSQCEKPGGVHVLLRDQFCSEYDSSWEKMHSGTVSIGKFYASYKNKEGKHVGQEIVEGEIDSSVTAAGKKAYDDAYARAYDQYKSSIPDFETNESEKKIAIELATNIANEVKKIAESDMYKIIISSSDISTREGGLGGISRRDLIFRNYHDYLEEHRLTYLRQQNKHMSEEEFKKYWIDENPNYPANWRESTKAGDRYQYNQLLSSIVTGAISKGDLLTQASLDVASATKSDADAKEFLSSAEQRSTDADKLLGQLEDEEKAEKVSAKQSKDAYNTLTVLNTEFTKSRDYIASDGKYQIPYSPPGKGQLGFAKPLDIMPDDFSQLSSSKSVSKTTADSSSAFYIEKHQQTKLARESAAAAKQLLTA
ncbi:MAG: hypothetical protein WCJ72_13345, partial [Chryseobacterium sp.]